VADHARQVQSWLERDEICGISSGFYTDLYMAVVIHQA
jgi:hypothetical protein